MTTEPLVLSTWKDINKWVITATEDQVKAALSHELGGSRVRKMYVLRLHSRMNKLRAARERKEILQQVKDRI